MPTEVIKVVASHPLTRLLAENSVETTPFPRYFDLTTTAPAGDGVISFGKDGSYTCERICVFPYSDAPPGVIFWFRVWGWRDAISRDNVRPTLFVPNLLVEMACVSGDLPGPMATPQLVAQSQNMCAAIAVTQGSLGASGTTRQMSSGACPAAAWIEVLGAQRVQFQFQRLETDNISMNALYARA